ncbi:MAG: hypothetical protein JSV22_12350 [Bacteroidales bacterium]|nr:MAG: hypothetical protein JSV22_12350 [Bacteroidales bacterium]
MNIKSSQAPGFYLDTLPDISNTDCKELIRSIEIQADTSDVFVWLNQLRVAPYSYDFLDNRSIKSPRYVIKNLPPLKINAHFLLAFHIYRFKENSFIAARFCEPINTPVDRYINGLYIEYRLIENGSKTELWCKIKGFVKKDISSRGFFFVFRVINKFMMIRQLKIIKKLSQRLAQGKVETKIHDIKSSYAQSGLHWWLFCRRHNCKGLIT